VPIVQTFITTNKFPNVRRNMTPALRERLDELLDDIALYAKAYAPIDTGELRASIHKTTSGVTATAKHASYQEYGTYKMQAQPFMRPAISTVMPGAPRYFGGLGARLLD